jgi:MoaA/NifB/PqqE/SkfB family radical SAM enzyme
MKLSLWRKAMEHLAEHRAARTRLGYEKKYQFPFFGRILLELQSNCNRDCFFCPRHGDDSGKRVAPDGSRVLKAMPTDAAIRIMDEAEAMGFRGRINFHHLSEPFLDKRVIDMAKEASRRGMHPYVNTNGDPLRSNEELCRRAASALEKINVGLYDCKTPQDIEREKAFWRERLQGTEVTFSHAAQNPRPRSFLELEAQSYPDSPCVRPLGRLIAHYDGSAALCCEDMKDEFELGNVFELGIEKVWFSVQHRRIVQDLLEGKRAGYPLCARCHEKPGEATLLSRRAARLLRTERAAG